MKRLILASQSPRRKQLLETLSIPFETIPSEVSEDLSDEVYPEDAVRELAYRKAIHVFATAPDAIVIGSDTVVAINGKRLEKPSSKEDAFAMLSELSGKEHTVYTGVAIISEEEEKVFVVKTTVQFWPLTEKAIREYIETGEPMDKAGSYGIQGKGALFVKEIKGDYYAVVGLPISQLHQVLTSTFM
ncbi:Maf family protein [Mangrovibacillus cuniculi]|uniref:dTTP/UTP pyrophosphatase n=1 Tax=Mangrovibacillus cuniculi TaxID=2593652 RepID=A0A7S8CBU2_9BACI|nr:Maf family protein [Mangrovibacillus cuniculi]QPC47052.1 septum formation inhibitor Maf [Mangrovibacillus cuniculi]